MPTGRIGAPLRTAISAGPAEGEGVMTQEDTPVSITLIGNDPDGDALTYNVVTGPSHGRLKPFRFSPHLPHATRICRVGHG